MGVGVAEWYEFLRTGGPLAFSIAILIGLYRGWWVPGPFHKETKEEIARLKLINDNYEAHFKTVIEVQTRQEERNAARHEENKLLMGQVRAAITDLAGQLVTRSGDDRMRDTEDRAVLTRILERLDRIEAELPRSRRAAQS